MIEWVCECYKINNFLQSCVQVTLWLKNSNITLHVLWPCLIKKVLLLNKLKAEIEPDYAVESAI